VLSRGAAGSLQLATDTRKNTYVVIKLLERGPGVTKNLERELLAHRRWGPVQCVYLLQRLVHGCSGYCSVTVIHDSEQHLSMTPVSQFVAPHWLQVPCTSQHCAAEGGVPDDALPGHRHGVHEGQQHADVPGEARAAARARGQVGSCCAGVCSVCVCLPCTSGMCRSQSCPA
jgi:hypothetical protein